VQTRDESNLTYIARWLVEATIGGRTGGVVFHQAR